MWIPISEDFVLLFCCLLYLWFLLMVICFPVFKWFLIWTANLYEQIICGDSLRSSMETCSSKRNFTCSCQANRAHYLVSHWTKFILQGISRWYGLYIYVRDRSFCCCFGHFTQHQDNFSPECGYRAVLNLVDALTMRMWSFGVFMEDSLLSDKSLRVH